MRLRLGLCITIATALTAIVGCGSDDPTTTTPAVDASKLDSGNYPAVPRAVETIRSGRSGASLEAIRIGTATPTPFDVDGRYAFQRLTNTDRRVTPGALSSPFSLSDDEWAELTKGFVAGWESSGERRKQPSLGRQVSMTVLRFPTATQADTAVRRLADRQAENLPGVPVQISGFPQARVKWSVSKKYLDAWLAHETMVLSVHMEDPVSEPAEPIPLVEFVQKTFTKQIEMLKNYSPTPVEQLGSLPLDVDGLLSRTLPLEDKERTDKSFDPSMVLPSQAALHFELRPALAKAAYDNSGVDLMSYSGARVYRTRDTDSTIRLIAAFVDQNSEGYKKIDGPPNLTGAQCYDTKDSKTSSYLYRPVCYFAYDRYVARVTSTNVQDLYQRTAAQYKLLAH